MWLYRNYVSVSIRSVATRLMSKRLLATTRVTTLSLQLLAQWMNSMLRALARFTLARFAEIFVKSD
jgi:hypothetical protein